MGINVAAMKLDRFADLSASFDGGTITTVPLDWPAGKRLFLNAESRWGQITVTARGDGWQTSAVLAGVEGVRLPVSFDSFSPGTVQLDIELRNAQLYALYWE